MESLPLVEVASQFLWWINYFLFVVWLFISPLNNVKNPSLSFIKIGSPYSSFPSFDSEPFLTFKSSLINLSLIQTNDEMFSSELNERRTYTNLLIPTEGHTGESCRFKSSPTSCKNLSDLWYSDQFMKLTISRRSRKICSLRVKLIHPRSFASTTATHDKVFAPFFTVVLMPSCLFSLCLLLFNSFYLLLPWCFI